MEGVPKISTEKSEALTSPEKIEDTIRSIFIKAAFEGLNAPSYSVSERDKVFDKEADLTNRFLSIVKEVPEDGSYAQGEDNAIKVETRGYVWKAEESDASVKEQVVQATVGNVKQVASILELVPHINSNRTLELNSILPPSCNFVPADFSEGSVMLSPHSDERIESRSFSFKKGDSIHTVQYGPIRTDEDIFSLLHEVAHAWQNRAKPTAIDNYEYSNKIVLMSSFCVTLSHLSKKKTLTEEEVASIHSIAEIFGRQDENPVDFMHTFLKRNGPLVQKMGVSFDGFDVTIDNPDLLEKIKDYVWAERHAWSVALKAYSALCDAGYTLSPEKKDFRGTVQAALNSYQEGLSFLEMSVDKNFVNIKKQNNAA